MRKKRTIFLAVLVIIFCLNIGAAFRTIKKIDYVKKEYKKLELEMSSASETVKREEETTENNMTESAEAVPRDIDILLNNLTDINQLENEGEQWSISVLDLNTSTFKSYNGEKEFPVSSDKSGRIYIMAAVYYYAVDATTTIPIKMNEEYEGELRVLLERMIQKDDSEAENQILSKLGSEAENQILSKLGNGLLIVNEYCQGHYYENTLVTSEGIKTSSDDCLRLLSSIYSGTCSSRLSSEKMLAILTESKQNSVNVDEVDINPVISNQSAFVFSKDYNYIMCILHDSNAENAQEKTEKIIKATDNWFSRH